MILLEQLWWPCSEIHLGNSTHVVELLAIFKILLIFLHNHLSLFAFATRKLTDRITAYL